MPLKVLILGVSGFIGNRLTEVILERTNWEVYGMDMTTDKISGILSDKRFHFFEGDITINKEWIEYHIRKCDVVLPLVAIATPALYVQDPLRVFNLDFMANLEIIRAIVRHKKRVVFPSTSEVYGMCEDPEFNEETSNLVLGPIHKQRWIYSCSKQLLDRVIYAHGVQDNLNYTLIRPFNWIGPKLDNIMDPKEGSSRVLTQFISNVIHGHDIKLVDGGEQHRCFTYIDDGIDALLKIIENKDDCASRRIFNLGNPENDVSIKTLAHLVLDLIKTYPRYRERADKVSIVSVDSEKYYGKSYQDAQARVPSIKMAETYLDWTPKIDLKTALKKTLDYHLKHPDESLTEEDN
ncbi:MAG: NAD-dependent epimerase/dehydratase family protein [Alphaproteobacteria bacterium 16-39-46]|nr:MAG: NAD-dependent epimerase/dehydratase family protein [Alphaproteobacteria bacterium 16-39-46]OZA43903.1 MAG: NAD-dependent epimerase/dehydratase family protein [Alphaproteobacteria bacterium 17-39-52]HQS83692.1 bifunctional UDP-4-keto-pentose/UDP-xylose synthase [Alphaproteobacteria bacterium]HQS93460.1 bifunctional UDP-4-keto-pentose/UDP-xylose synthase [Alphaproteobacteria bacterium]